MGKASRRKKQGDAPRRIKTGPVPFVRRPFDGLPGETDWVALHEILPAASAVVTLDDAAVRGSGEVPDDADVPATVTVASVLPMSMAGLRRQDGSVMVGAQSGSRSGDASRDLAATILTTLTLEPGEPLLAAPSPTEQTPRLQDLLVTADPLDVTVHEGFEFWADGAELEGEAAESMERANEVIVPTVAVPGVTSAYWCRIGARTYIRLVLGDDEDAATNALARLHAAGTDALGDDSTLLGAFRSAGLLVPVIEVDPEADPESFATALADLLERYLVALASTEPLNAEERRAKSGLLSRQMTLR